jgi:hypothetical protein
MEGVRISDLETITVIQSRILIFYMQLLIINVIESGVKNGK